MGPKTRVPLEVQLCPPVQLRKWQLPRAAPPWDHISAELPPLAKCHLPQALRSNLQESSKLELAILHIVQQTLIILPLARIILKLSGILSPHQDDSLLWSHCCFLSSCGTSILSDSQVFPLHYLAPTIPPLGFFFFGWLKKTNGVSISLQCYSDIPATYFSESQQKSSHEPGLAGEEGKHRRTGKNGAGYGPAGVSEIHTSPSIWQLTHFDSCVSGNTELKESRRR